jgi:hypothetical protein
MARARTHVSSLKLIRKAHKQVIIFRQFPSQSFNQLLSLREAPDLVQISVEVLEDDLTNK